ncbi:MAG: hypothetical protein JST44_27920 [Cyanobacteria bacterium SZAS LIN-5]|nr:hypothetical protein [Cyanobacteria bacterium SZAS LIN-5]RTL42772.1 MAG: hypothetical protein EKK48_12365 [Candidatus Melainabacteria bacterium]
MRRRTPTIATKLAAPDHIKFDQFCRLEGKTKTEVAREAIRYYMKTRESELLDEQQSPLEKRLLKMENRFASLLVKLGVGIFATEHLLWSRMGEDERGQLFSECYASGVKKMRSKLRPEEDELREQTGS